MIRRPRITVRRLMKWVGITAVALALGRYSYQYLREQQRFYARAREGDKLVRYYSVQRPPAVPPVSWDGAVANVQVAWDNVVVSPEHIDVDDLDAVVSRMRVLVRRATPDDAEGDLYLILDLLAHARTKAGAHYLSGQRESIKRDLPGLGRPSPGLADVAMSRVGWPPGQPVLGAITAGMRASDWETRVACCRALGQYGLGLGTPAEAEAALAGLIRALDDDDHLVREVAVEGLHEMGAKASRACNPLIARLARDPDVRVRGQAARVLPAIATDRPTVIPALIGVVGTDASASVRSAAIDALTRLGPEASAALPTLIGSLERDSVPAVRGMSAWAIARIAPGDPMTIASLARALKRESAAHVRAAAAEALGRIGQTAAAAVPSLDNSLMDPDPSVRTEAETALRKILARP
jgi:hypothetical protein